MRLVYVDKDKEERNRDQEIVIEILTIVEDLQIDQFAEHNN